MEALESKYLFLLSNFIIIAKKLRVNKAIRSQEVLLIDGEEQLGVKSIEEAMEIARQRETDLVEVSPKSRPPVCKLMDFGNYLYNLKKRERAQRKNTKKTETKTIRLSIRTDLHDLEVKARKARKFLEDRNLVKVALIFRGRELSHQDLGYKKMDQFFNLLEDVCTIEQKPRKLGHQMIMMLNPIK